MKPIECKLLYYERLTGLSLGLRGKIFSRRWAVLIPMPDLVMPLHRTLGHCIRFIRDILQSVYCSYPDVETWEEDEGRT